MLLFEPRAGFGCDCLRVAAASPSPECHGDPCQTGSLAESSSTVLVLLILDNASCFKPLGVITSLQSSILLGRNPLVIPTLPGNHRSGARMCLQTFCFVALCSAITDSPGPARHSLDILGKLHNQACPEWTYSLSGKKFRPWPQLHTPTPGFLSCIFCSNTVDFDE
jgi:hypothetical protein